MLRIDESRRPGMFHYATISAGEVDALRTIDDVIRQGHVKAIERERLVLDNGEVSMPVGTLYIDCTASAVERRPAMPVFQPGRITCQIVRAPQPAFSAALVAYVEAHYADDKERNAMCATVPFPDRPGDYPRTILANMRNEAAWAKDATLRHWIRASRLDGFGKIVDAVTPEESAKRAVLGRIRAAAMPAFANLKKLAN